MTPLAQPKPWTVHWTKGLEAAVTHYSNELAARASFESIRANLWPGEAVELRINDVPMDSAADPGGEA